MTKDAFKQNLIVGLAGGLLPNGTLPSHVEKRVNCCVELAKQCTGSTVLFSSCYTLNKPPVLSKNAYPLSEASAMAKRAKSLGCDAPILCEQQSHDTIGSAYFVFLNFVEVWRPDRLHIVTSHFHMNRAKAIFLHVATLFNFPLKDVEFLVSDTLSAPQRERAEIQSLARYNEQWAKITDQTAFGRELFTNHNNYNSNYSSGAMPSGILETY